MNAGVLVRIGAPVVPARNGSPEIVSPFRSAGLKNVKASACCPLPRTFKANAFVSLMSAWAWESVLTPTATRGGSNEAWVTQLGARRHTAVRVGRCQDVEAVRNHPERGLLRVGVHSYLPPGRIRRMPAR